MGLRAVFRVPDPDEKVVGWHVSPLIDLSAYSLSWLFVLVPLLMFGPTRADYLYLYLLTIGLTDLHRHFGLPYVYLDSDVRRRYPARFWLFPGLLLLAWAASPFLDHASLRLSIPGVFALAGLLLLLLQILRRDGGEAAVPVTTLAGVLGGSMGTAAILHVWCSSFALAFDSAWWWLAAALFASTWFDWQRTRRLAARGSPTSDAAREMAISGPRSRPEPGPSRSEAISGPRSRPEPGPSRSEAIATTGAPAFAVSTGILALIGAALLLGRWRPMTIEIAHVLAVVGVFAALWNFWHVYMQKYGIMRMYSAKARGRFAGELDEVPGWSDRALVLCWLPLYFAYLGPLYREIAVDYFDDAKAVLPGFIDALEHAMPVTIPVTLALVLVVHGLWLQKEWQANRLRSVPRLLMAAGTTGLAACFFLFDPVKVYLAFAFSHALEYCVFVWAFQRKRYQQPLEHDPALGRLLRHPVLFYLGMVLLFAVAFLLLKYWGRFIMPDAARPELLGYRTAYWLGFWGVYQSMVHFYFDGFLWKMRLPSVRANI